MTHYPAGIPANVSHALVVTKQATKPPSWRRYVDVWGLPRKGRVHLKGVDLTHRDLERFLFGASQGDNSECWPWSGLLNGSGYGVCYIGAPHLKGRKTMPVLATRLSWVLANRKDIPEGLMVCHHCDNPQCINPHHLYAGTAKDNVHDAISRGRLRPYDIAHCPKARGEASGKSKLTEAQARETKTRYAAGGVLMKDLAAEFGVSKSTIAGVINGRVWKHVQPDAGLHNVTTATDDSEHPCGKSSPRNLSP